MSEPLEFNCPHCGQLYRLTGEQMLRYAGRTSNCRKCNRAFTFPADEAALSPASPPGKGEEAAALPMIEYGRRAPILSSLRWGDLLMFRQMIAPWAIIVVFWLGVVGILGTGGLALWAAFHVPAGARWTGSGFAYQTEFSLPAFLWAVGQIILGPILWRICCEVLIVIFRIHETLRDMRGDGGRR
jgi:predicted Zn finger-like uncharacterized protein